MAIEIELKARIGDPETLRLLLRGRAGEARNFHKQDQYWRREGVDLGSGIRLRSEDASSPEGVLNFKRKEVRRGIEINDEHEFCVSDTSEAALLLERLGLRPWITKEKKGEAWEVDGILAELAEITGLGWFLELEILADSDSEATVCHARERLLSLLDSLAVPRSAIEERYYTEMLAAR